ncbi:MAG: molybdenum cofactor biosynthesis protein MoaE [Chloroflexi bacterium]|nr:molybdenum cofactor biosynthesis protein MoaE [Chloroflexota bacterium]
MSETIVITHHELNPEEFTDLVRRDTNGAVVTFLGTTRDTFEGRNVIRLEYEAYEEMAYRKLEEIRQELKSEFGVEDVAIGHRIGVVDIGEISLVVAVASPHRSEAFYACHEAVNRLKHSVPIWKKEFYEGGEHWVACEDHEFTGSVETPETLTVSADNA